MAAYRHAMGQSGGKRLAIGIGAIVGALLLVILSAERGAFSHLGSYAQTMALPGITLDNDDDDRRPVVTSVRSNGSAERAGIRAGDEIEAVDNRPVHDVAALKAALLADRSGRPALHMRRGDALWTVAIDRGEPASDNMAAMSVVNGAENPPD